MNNFRTDVRVTPSAQKINLTDKVLAIGSCFADAIGERLQKYKFHSLINPFGVIYNPPSIHKTLRYGIHQELPAPHTYTQHHDINFNYDFHSQLSALNKNELTVMINNTIGSAHYFLKDAQWLLITYGTSWVYNRKDTGEIVANCHKIPADSFTKSLLSEKEIVESFREFHQTLLKFNPNVRIILTLSPVRHIKDTLTLNSTSKATLRVACHHIEENFAGVEYFPAYEMMMDDLRDYRFYKSDMLHPTSEAEDYIWEKFGERYFSQDTQKFLKQWKRILMALSHKPFHLNSSAHQQFLTDTIKKLDELKEKVDVTEEITLLRSRLV